MEQAVEFGRGANLQTSFRAVLSYTQKAHFKSTHMQKLHLALDIYRGLGTVPATRVDTITKVISMLLHPFPKVTDAHDRSYMMPANGHLDSNISSGDAVGVDAGGGAQEAGLECVVQGPQAHC